MTIDRYVQSVMKRLKMESTNVVAVVQMLTQGVPNTSTLFAPQLFTRTKSVQLWYAALQVYSTRIASTFSLPQAIKRRLACYIASTWTDFCAVFLTRMPITCMCFNKLKGSTSSSTNAKPNPHRIRPSCSLIKLFFPNVTVAEHPYSANQKPTFSLIPRITSGAQQLRRRQRGRYRVIIALLLLELPRNSTQL